MAKLKSNRLGKKEQLSAQDKKEEARFFKIAIVVTLVLIVIMYLIYAS